MTKSSSDHLESARVLLDEIPSYLSALQDEYKQCVKNLEVSPKFRVQTQAFLVQLRSILDYLSHEMVRFCSSVPGKVYFPIAKVGMSKADFEKKLRTYWLPGIDIGCPSIFNYLIKLQYFYPGNEWLPAFHEISNKNKHVKLSRMEIAGFNAAFIRLDGKIVMQIGDRGYRSLKLGTGAALVFGSCPRRSAIRGPQTIDQSTKKLHDADPGLDVVLGTWKEFKFNEFPQQPAIVFLKIADKEVRQISKEIETLISIN